MTVVNPKSISGINSITTGSGSDNLLTIHTNDGTERVRVDSTGTTKIVTGIVTTLTATGSAKVGSGVTLSPDGDGFFTGVVTATSYSGIDLGAVTGATGDFSIADKIVHTGDTDTAIRFPSADTVRIDTAGSNRFKIDSNGRIGILDPNLDNFDSSADDLVINGAANTGITINSGGTTSTSEGALVFAEGNGSGGSADGFRGAIQYKHGDDRMMFYTNN